MIFLKKNCLCPTLVKFKIELSFYNLLREQINKLLIFKIFLIYENFSKQISPLLEPGSNRTLLVVILVLNNLNLAIL